MRSTSPMSSFRPRRSAPCWRAPIDGDLSFAELRRARRPRAGHAERPRRRDDLRSTAASSAPTSSGAVHRVEDSARTPFAVVARFAPTVDESDRGPALPRRAPGPARRARPDRSVLLRGSARRPLRAGPRPLGAAPVEPPYRPLAEVVAEQHVFDLTGVDGTMVGFRFPAMSRGSRSAGYHLHFISADRRRGGHVLGSSCGSLRVRIDPSTTCTSSCRRHRSRRPRPRRRDPCRRSSGWSAWVR